MTSDPLDSNEERAALINYFHDICENKDSFMGMLKYLNRFAPRPPEGHLALDLYFVMETQLEKHPYLWTGFYLLLDGFQEEL